MFFSSDIREVKKNWDYPPVQWIPKYITSSLLHFFFMVVQWQHLKSTLKDAIPRTELVFSNNFWTSFGVVNSNNNSNLLKLHIPHSQINDRLVYLTYLKFTKSRLKILFKVTSHRSIVWPLLSSKFMWLNHCYYLGNLI